jgi:hypothetical protein
MRSAEAVHAYLVPCLADVLSGFGLSTLLEFSRISPEMRFYTAICVVVLAAWSAFILFGPAKRVPVWLALCNTTYSLVLTLSLSLNLLAQLCPPSGRDLSLIPVYALLCVPRMPPSTKGLALQAVFSLLLVAVFLTLPTSRHVRPTGDVGDGLSVFVSLGIGVALQTFKWEHDDCMHSDWQGRKWQALSVACKGVLLVLLGHVRNTSLYHFMFDRPSTVPKELFVAYGVLLVFACMQTASVWFVQLRDVLGNQTQWRLVVRIQHIIYALIVAVAWTYPLQLHAVRIAITSVLFGLNMLA